MPPMQSRWRVVAILLRDLRSVSSEPAITKQSEVTEYHLGLQDG